MIVRMAGLFIGIILLSIVFTTIRSRLMAHVSQEIIYDIRKDLFAHLQRLPFSYYDSRPAGKILVRVINYVNSVSDILSNGIINMILEIINLVFIVIFMFSTNAELAAIILAGLPFFVAIIVILKPRQRKAWQNQSNKNSNYNAYLAESIDGVRVSQLFDRQGGQSGHHAAPRGSVPPGMDSRDSHQQRRMAFQRNDHAVRADVHVYRRRLLDGRLNRELRRNSRNGAVRQPLLAADYEPCEHL